jgi:hypothetical protein
MSDAEIKQKLATYAHENLDAVGCDLSFAVDGKPSLSMGEKIAVTPVGDLTQAHRSRGTYPVQLCFPMVAQFTLALWGVDEGSAQMLTGLVQMLQPHVVLETGTSAGRSTRALAEGLVANGKGHLWTVDMCDYHIHQSGALRGETALSASPGGPAVRTPRRSGGLGGGRRERRQCCGSRRRSRVRDLHLRFHRPPQSRGGLPRGNPRHGASPARTAGRRAGHTGAPVRLLQL